MNIMRTPLINSDKRAQLKTSSNCNGHGYRCSPNIPRSWNGSHSLQELFDYEIVMKHTNLQIYKSFLIIPLTKISTYQHAKHRITVIYTKLQTFLYQSIRAWYACWCKHWHCHNDNNLGLFNIFVDILNLCYKNVTAIQIFRLQTTRMHVN